MIKSLTSWRFVFAITIFLHHYSIQDSSVFEAGGTMAVAFFFILSGFVLTYSYSRRIDRGGISWVEFMKNRLFRLYPMHLLLFCCFFGLWILGWAEGGWANAFLNMFLLQSWVPVIQTYFSFNAVSWCLSDELFFYALFPFIVLPLLGMSWRKLLGFSAGWAILYLTAASLTPDSWRHWAFYINPLSRVFDFILGIILCRIYNRITPPQLSCWCVTLIELSAIVIVAVAVVVYYLLPESVNIFQILWWLPVSYLILTFSLSAKSPNLGWISEILSYRYLVLLGRASFCFFMIHILVIRFMSGAMPYVGINPDSISGALTTFIVTTLVCIPTMLLFEEPVGNYLKRRFKS